MSETPEEVFWKYARPCIDDLKRLDAIDSGVYDSLMVFFRSGTVPGRDLLESAFPNAIKRLVRFFEDENYWTVDNIRRYFLVYHNEVIDNKEDFYADKYSDQKIRDLCKVCVGIVLEKKGPVDNVIYLVDFGDKKEPVAGKYFLDANVGDKVSVHWRFAIEKL